MIVALNSHPRRSRASAMAVLFRAQKGEGVLAYSQHTRRTVMANLLWRIAMSREANHQRLQQLQQAIEQNPGQRVGFFARLLGWPHETVNRELVTLNDQGVLLSEDQTGGLWPFRPRQGEKKTN